jgi:hypothetical protein
MGGNSQAVRRTLTFKNLDDLVSDLQSVSTVGIGSSGGWTPAQNVEHVARGIDTSIDGFTFTVPLPMRILGRLIKGRVLTKGIPAGKIKIPPAAQAAFCPGPETRFEDAAKHLTDAVERAKRKKMTAVSPIFGKLSHEQWVALHCRHAEMHFSFLHPAAQTDDPTEPDHGARHAPATA